VTTIKQRLEVFCDMALQLRRDASTLDEEELVGEVLMAMWCGGRGMGSNVNFHDLAIADDEFADRLRVALHGTLGEKIAATGAVHVVSNTEAGMLAAGMVEIDGEWIIPD
jgi:hypothetical protein